MFKIDKVKSLFDCDLCNQVLIDPVTISCGNNICKSHLDKLIKNKDKTAYKCKICYEEHDVPKSGFIINKKLQNGLTIQLNTLKLTPIFEECKIEIQKATENVTKIEELEKNSESYIYEYFEDIKREVDIRREKLKTDVDKYSNEVIQSIENTQLNYMKLSKQASQISKKIGESKKELDDYIKQFDTFEIDEKKFENIKNGVVDVNQHFLKIINDYNYSLVGNTKYLFSFKEIPIADVFGCFHDFKFKFDSLILDTDNLKIKLNKLCEFPDKQNWDLKYRGSRDGFSAQKFHSICDGITETLTVIKSTNGNIFGGFAEQAWRSQGNVTDTNAFIYSLINKENKPFKALFQASYRDRKRTEYSEEDNEYYSEEDNEYYNNEDIEYYNNEDNEYYNNNSNIDNTSIFCNLSYGPSFGYVKSGHYDLQIASNSCRSDFGYSYKHQDYPAGSSKASSILAGSASFETVEIEVFAKKN